MFPSVMNSLSVGVFSCETPCSARRENSCGERFSVVGDNANFGNVVSPFSSRGKKKNIFSELIHTLLKLPNCVLKQQPHILQFSEALGSVFSLFKELALSAYCHFHSFFDLPEVSKPSANKSNTRYSLATSISRCIKFTKRTELWIDIWQLYELIVLKTDSRFFSSRCECVRLLRCSYSPLNQFGEKHRLTFLQSSSSCRMTMTHQS